MAVLYTVLVTEFVLSGLECSLFCMHIKCTLLEIGTILGALDKDNLT